MARYNFTIRAEDETGAFADREFAIEVKNDLVERMVVVDTQNAYSSIDGTRWTIRAGQGGDIVKRVGNYWIVGNVMVYRRLLSKNIKLSSDAINWTQKTLPCDITSANSFHFINGEYYFLGTGDEDARHTIWKTKDFDEYVKVYESDVYDVDTIFSNYNRLYFPVNMIYHNNELIFMNNVYNWNVTVLIEGSGVVRFNVNTGETVRHLLTDNIYPTGSSMSVSTDKGYSIHVVNDAYILYGMRNNTANIFDIPHYTFDFKNYNISNIAGFANEAEYSSIADFVYHNGNVIVGYRGSSFHLTKNLQDYTKLYQPAALYPRDIVSYKGMLYTIPHNLTAGKLLVGSVEDYKTGTLTNLSEGDDIIKNANLLSVAVLR